jgi:hypothetical protein
MANVQGAFGFTRMGGASGPVNFGAQGNPPYRMLSGQSTAIFFGDAVRMETTPLGEIVPWVVGDGTTATRILVGIFQGCRYYSASQKKTIWNNYWPGSDAIGDVECFVDDDPQSTWKVQANAGPLNYTTIGQTVDIVATPVGNVTTGISGMAIGTPTTLVTNPFKVVGLVTSPPTANGADITTAFNNVIVAFNNSQYKALLGV